MPKTTICNIPDCGNFVRTRGYCAAHYKRILKYGDPAINKRVTHGQKGTKLYAVHRSMLGRCTSKTHQAYHHYGGRGINVCPEWLKFEGFLEWSQRSGYKEGLSLGRIDNDKGYLPENCRWETYKEQNNNTRSSRRITIDDETRTLMQWCEQYNHCFSTVWWRIKRGWSEQRAILTPAHKYLRERRVDLSRTDLVR